MAKHDLPPLDGSLATVIDFTDFHAVHNASSPWFTFPSPLDGRLASISFGELAASSHQIAAVLRPQRGGPENEVVILLLHVDNIIYVPVFLGVLRAGYIVSTNTLVYADNFMTFSLAVSGVPTQLI